MNDEIKYLKSEVTRLTVELDNEQMVNRELEDDIKRLTQQLHNARLENSGQAAELERRTTRPEPSRLEVAAMIYAAWNANPEIEILRRNGSDRAQCFEPCGAVEEADSLIAAAKEARP